MNFSTGDNFANDNQSTDELPIVILDFYYNTLFLYTKIKVTIAQKRVLGYEQEFT